MGYIFHKIPMKNILLTILFCMIPLSVTAGTPYFPEKAGSILRYQRSDSGNGKTVWEHEMQVLEEKNTKDGREMICRSHFSKPGGKQAMDVDYKTIIDTEGNVTSDLAASLVSAIRNFLPKMEIKAEFSPTTLPSVLIPGRKLPDASSEIAIKGKIFSVDVTERKVLREEALSTPAGTFDCVVVTEHKTEKFTLYNRDTISYTWYAKGVGMVRHDTWKNGRCETSEVLVSLDN